MVASAPYVYAVDNIEILTITRLHYIPTLLTILIEQTYPRPNRFLSPTSFRTTAVWRWRVFRLWVQAMDAGIYTKDEIHAGSQSLLLGEKPQLDRIRFKVITDAGSYPGAEKQWWTSLAAI